MAKLRIGAAHLVYQVGLANVFAKNEHGEMKRLIQGDYHTCETYAAGLRAAGCLLSVMHCNRAGDVREQQEYWKAGKGKLWAEKKHPPGPLAPIAGFAS